MKQLKSLLSKIIFFSGLIFMCILAVPTAILFGMISVVNTITDFMTQKLDK